MSCLCPCCLCRIVGEDTQRGRVNETTFGQEFVDAMYQSFSQQYSHFSLLCKFGVLKPAVSAPVTNVTVADPSSGTAPSFAALGSASRASREGRVTMLKAELICEVQKRFQEVSYRESRCSSCQTGFETAGH